MNSLSPIVRSGALGAAFTSGGAPNLKLFTRRTAGGLQSGAEPVVKTNTIGTPRLAFGNSRQRCFVTDPDNPAIDFERLARATDADVRRLAVLAVDNAEIM